MDCKDLVLDGLSRVDENLRRHVRGLSVEQLLFRPSSEANSIGWIAWHLTRVQDDHISTLAGRPQAWIDGGWAGRFGRAADADDTGYGHSAADVAAFRVSGAAVLLDYHAAVHQRTVEYVNEISCSEMDRVVDTNWNPPVTLGVRLVSVVDDCAQHIGQIGYVRGLLPSSLLPKG
jgi:hypothetical protein